MSHSINNKYAVIVFDWDGTLVDSAGFIVSCFQETAQHLALRQASNQTISETIGLDMYLAVKVLYPDISEQKVKTFIQIFRKLFFKHETIPVTLFPEVITTLHTLRDRQHQLAIATGKGRAGLDHELKQLQLNPFFMTSRCASETMSKPHPHMLLEIIEELSVQPEQVLMIGDSIYDVEMAYNAKVNCLGVAQGAQNHQQLIKAGAVDCLTQISDLIEWLDMQNTESFLNNT